VLVKVGAIKAVTSVLEKIGIKYTIYDGVEPNPTIEQVLFYANWLKLLACLLQFFPLLLPLICELANQIAVLFS